MGLNNVNFARTVIPTGLIASQSIAGAGTATSTPFYVGHAKGRTVAILLTLGVLPASSSGSLAVQYTTSEVTSGATWAPLMSNPNMLIRENGMEGSTPNTSVAIQVTAPFVTGSPSSGALTLGTLDLDYIPEEARWIRFVITNGGASAFVAGLAAMTVNLFDQRMESIESIDMFYKLQRYSLA
jgi:hypothetical protein